MADDDWPDPDWPEDDDWPEPPGFTQESESKRRCGRMLSFVLVALVGLAAGTGVALAIKDAHGAGPQTASTAPSAGIRQPSLGPGPLGGAAQLVVGGRVTAVSPDSITIGAGQGTVTARVTASTRFVGSVGDIAGVRVGDQVLAQIAAGSSGRVVLILQDPASVP